MDISFIWLSDPLYRFFTFFIFGSMVGSFANVVIYRRPVMRWHPEKITEKPFNLSVPHSRCPKCKNKLRFYHNIPIFSWLFLKGKCAFCQCKIPKRYPLVELSFGLVGLVACAAFTSLVNAFIFSFCIWGLMTCAMIFHDHQRLDRPLTILFSAALFCFSFYFSLI